MKRKIFLITFIIAIIIVGRIVGSRIFWPKTSFSVNTTTASTVKFVESTIIVNGVVTAQNQAKLSFPTSGKLVYLPFKEGDEVKAGQTIAKLDSYALQRQLTASLNNYKITRDTFDQTQQNSQNNVLKSQVAPNYAKANTNIDDTINEAIKRILDQNQMTLDNSVINVELANYALQLSTLTSPITGVITHEDVGVAGVNITPTASFVVADPSSTVFRANIPLNYIYYITPGSEVTLAIDGLSDKITGTVSKIYPTRVTLNNGQSVYQADIVSDDLKNKVKLDQSGTAIITTNAKNVALVPAWVVLDGKYIWVEKNGTPQLQEVQVGKIHDNEIEIISGLSSGDKIITDPKYITTLKYSIL